MVTEKKRIEISNWIEYATKSWETEGEASLYTIDEALKVNRMLELLEIADDLSDEDYARLKAMPADQADWSAVKDILWKYTHCRLSWIELRWIARFDRDDAESERLLYQWMFDTFGIDNCADHADPVSTDVQQPTNTKAGAVKPLLFFCVTPKYTRSKTDSPRREPPPASRVPPPPCD